MFFEDEKDDIIIDSNADIQISDDGTVSWDDILNDGDDDLISLKNQAEPEPVKEISTNELSDDSLVGLEDELQYVDDDIDDVDDEQLQKILNDETSASEEVSPKQKAFDTFGSADDVEVDDKSNYQEEEFDIDAQLANAAASSSAGQKVLKDRTPRGEIKIGANVKKSNTPLLLAILAVVLVVFGVYTFNGNSKISHGDLTSNEQTNTVQENLNNTTQEDIASRSEEDIPVVNEEQIDDIKPILEDNSNEKELVSVVQTGRQDPFLPLSKYTAVVADKKQTPIAIPKKTAIENPYFEKPPVVIKDKNIAYVKSREIGKISSFRVTGVMYDLKNPAAIVNFDNVDYFVKIGDMIDQFVVKDIKRNYVVLAHRQYTLRANIAEEIDTSMNKEIVGIVKSGTKRTYATNDIKHNGEDVTQKQDNNNMDAEYFSQDQINVFERKNK